MTPGAIASVVSAAGSAAAASPVSLRTWRAGAVVLALLVAVVWTIAQGKDVHWDALNYHLYLGFSALNDRWTQDFFAAGPPSYLNPYAYVPLYLMTHSGWSALAIAGALAAWHALVLWFTYEIALAAGLRARALMAPGFALLAMALAASNPVLLHGLGSTMIDLSTAVFVLAGWLAIVIAVRGGGASWLLLAGAACGIAAALKLSNAVFALAALPALGMLPGRAHVRLKGIVLFCLASAATFALVALPWSLELWRNFGNPFFPFFNQHFRSPDFTAEALRYERFIPSDLLAFLARPFAMMSAGSHVHTEPRAPDLRYAMLLLGLAAWATVARLRVSSARETSGDTDDREAGRALASLLIGLVVAWCLWLAISGNSRYFLPMSSIASVALALVLQRFFARWRDATVAVVLGMVAMQAVQFGLGTDWKREGGAWEGPWLRVDVPQRLRDEPQLYLAAGFLSGSAFMPYLHPQSGMINIGGFNSIAPGYPGYARAQALIERNADRLRILVPLPQGVVDRATLPGPPESLWVYVRRLGLRIDGADCEFLRIEGNLRGERRPGASGSGWKAFLGCRLVPAPAERLAYERAVRDIDPVFDRVEDACPKLFHPRRPPTQEFNYLSRAYHMGSEMQLFVDGDRIKYFFPLRGGDAIDIGTVEAWQRAPQPIDCSVRTRAAFLNFAR